MSLRVYAGSRWASFSDSSRLNENFSTTTFKDLATLIVNNTDNFVS